MMKRLFLLGLISAGILVLGFLFRVRHAFYGPHDKIMARIGKGVSAKMAAEQLEREGIIQSPAAFLILAKISGASRHFHYGPYVFEKNRYWQILKKISRGETHKIKVVIPEGWSAWQIAERLASEGIISDAEAFWKNAMTLKLEGKLFPSTYFFEPGTDTGTVTQAFLDPGRKIFTPELLQRAAALKMNEAQVLAFASIIEREARVDEEREVISSVYHNRLKKGMMLEADPTVQYAMGQGKEWKDRLLYKDLKFVSPFNTYRNRGLPPAPICSPGLKSIQAALNPADTPYLYFVADGTGRHKFFKDHKSHIQWQIENRRKQKKTAN